MSVTVKPKTFHYDAAVRWEADKSGVLSAADRPDLKVSSPPEFRGQPGTWTPEHLFVSAVNACTMLTFLSLAARKELTLASYECDARGALEQVDGRFRFTRITLHPRIAVQRREDVEPARALFVEAENTCLVSSSIHTRVEGEPEVTVTV